MRDLIERLESARGVIEARFLAAGDLLSEAVDGIAALGAKLDAVTSAPGPEAIAAIARQLGESSARLYGLPAQQNLRRAAIGRLLEQRAVLADRVGDMRQSLAYMRAFSVSIKITAGGIITADAEFGVFAQEIVLRLESGRAEVDRLGGCLATLKVDLEAAVQRADDLLRSCMRMIPAVPEQLLASAALMTEHSHRTAAAAADAGRLARDVHRRVARMLGALQIGDITRQRIEHVQSGIALLALDAGSDDAAEDTSLAGSAAMRMRPVLAALLAAQLEAALEDFSREVDAMSLGLTGLAGDAAALLNLRDLAYGKNAGGSGGLLRALEERVGGTLGLVHEIEEAATQAQETGQAAASAAQVLSDRLGAVQEMKTDVTYMALNTTLKSARLGDVGKPLSTIATELRAQAGILEGVANGCMATLRALVATAAELAAKEETDAAGQGTGGALLAAVERINAAVDLTEREVAALAAQGEAVIDLLTQSTDRVGFGAEVGDALDEVAQSLRDLAADAEPCADDIATRLGALFGQLSALYTMAQEREIHAAIAARFGVGADSDAEPPQAVAPASEDLEDVLF
jgi:hypothetical protein